MDKINRQLHSGRKLTKSGKADGQELKDTERQKLEADKAKWLDMKEKAKNDKEETLGASSSGQHVPQVAWAKKI